MTGVPSFARSLQRAAVRHGAFRWVEWRLFELTGAWAAAPGMTAEARVHLAEVARQHAWHTELWADRLPVLDGVDPDALTRPAGPVLGPLVDALAGVAAAGGEGWDVAALSGLYRVLLPRLVLTYEDELARGAPVTDAPAIRALELVLRDERRQWRRGEQLLESRCRLASDVESSVAIQRQLELLVVVHGAGSGVLATGDGGAIGAI